MVACMHPITDTRKGTFSSDMVGVKERRSWEVRRSCLQVVRNFADVGPSRLGHHCCPNTLEPATSTAAKTIHRY